MILGMERIYMSGMVASVDKWISVKAMIILQIGLAELSEKLKAFSRK